MKATVILACLAQAGLVSCLSTPLRSPHVLALRSPDASSDQPTVQISHPQATILGSEANGIDTFTNIPYAQPPVGQLRLNPPQPLVAPLGTINATGTAVSCPQLNTTLNTAGLTPAEAILLEGFFAPPAYVSEDCLILNVQRPNGTKSGDNLPVVFFIYGGAFETGDTLAYDATTLISSAVAQEKPFVFVSINYRVAGFGFLPGKEVLAANATNLGLRDQRLALHWVADNIASFGGDPSQVTIWGESSGAWSVLDQIVLYQGQHQYNGKSLFRAAIMDSGSILPTEPVDGESAQAVYDLVVSNAGCGQASDTLACLRNLPYEAYQKATSNLPGYFGYRSLALEYLARPDGHVLVDSPDVLVSQGRYVDVPFIIGDQEDEGTLFSLSQRNISTSKQVLHYFTSIFFPTEPAATVQGYVQTYPDTPAAGSPFRTGSQNELYPEYKRLAAIIGDYAFTLQRRIFLTYNQRLKPTSPTWSYLMTYNHSLPFIGTTHGLDLAEIFGYEPGAVANNISSYYISFFHSMNPNAVGSNLLHWPRWNNGQQLLNFGNESDTLLPDTFRQGSFEQLMQHELKL